MVLLNVVKELQKLGYPVAYHSFLKAQTPPFIIYITPSTNNFMADGKTYHVVENNDIELYTSGKEKPRTDMAKVEKVFDRLDIAWDRTSIYIEGENVTKTTYEMRMI